MGALYECHYNVDLKNGVNLKPETMAIEDAVRVLLQGLGEDINREGLRKTPHRVAKALLEGTRGYNQKVKDIVSGALFPEAAGGSGGLVIVRDLDFFSYCESCLLPFQVKCHIGYIPSCNRVLGLSKLSRVAEVFAKRLQDPHRLAHEICSSLHQNIKPTGVAVVLQCSHIHFPDFRSTPFDHPNHIKTQVISGLGVFEDRKSDNWIDFFSLLRFRGIKTDDNTLIDDKSWCPFQNLFENDESKLDSVMVEAVSSILGYLGEDLSRKELLETPARFVNWLMNFKNSVKPNGFVTSKRHPLVSNNNQEEHIVCSEMNLPFWSQCEHHLLPFHGVVHIGYYGSKRVRVDPVGRSTLESIVRFYGFKLQVQERLTRQIAETVSSYLGEDVIVVVEANHTCMISRGIEKFGSNTATVAVLGRFSTNTTARAKFLQVIPKSSQ